MSWDARNRAWLARHDPELLEEIQQANLDEIQIIETRRGSQTLLFRGVPVHSRVDPEREALKLCAGDAGDLHIHFGLGLGYFLQADRAAKKTLVLEPQPGFLAMVMETLDLEAMLAHREVYIGVGLTRFRERLAQLWQPQTSVKWIISPFHEGAYPQLLRTLKEIVDERKLRDRNVKQTVAELMPQITQSSLQSVVFASQSPSIAALKNRFKKNPAILISPGPSLERMLPWLRFVQRKAVLIAGARSVSMLDQAGVQPDLLIHNEARSYIDLLQNATNLHQTLAVLADQCHASMYRYFTGRSFVYRHPMNGVSRWMNTEFKTLQHEPLPTGGSVATEALSLAVHMGCNPIVLLGQDLCLQHGKRYAGNKSNDVPVTQTLAGVWQQAVQVPNDYLSFVFWFRDTALRLRKNHSELGLFNASQGARLHGFDPVDLRRLASASWPTLQVASILQAAYCKSGIEKSAILERVYDGIERCQEVVELCQQFEGLSTERRTSLGVAKLEQQLFRLREALPFLDGLTPHVQSLLDETKGDQMRIAPAFFAAYRNAAVTACRLLRHALAEPNAADPS